GLRSPVPAAGAAIPGSGPSTPTSEATMTMDQRYRRNTPVQAEARLGESAASRFAGWIMHAPAERVPLVVAAPLWLLALIMHVAAHLGHFTRGAVAVTAVAAAI